MVVVNSVWLFRSILYSFGKFSWVYILAMYDIVFVLFLFYKYACLVSLFPLLNLRCDMIFPNCPYSYNLTYCCLHILLSFVKISFNPFNLQLFYVFVIAKCCIGEVHAK